VDNKTALVVLSAVLEEEEKEASSSALPVVADEEAAIGVELGKTVIAAGEAVVEKIETIIVKQKTSLQDYSKREYIFVIILGLTMSFLAGYSNGVCLSGYIEFESRVTRQSVAGVTGLYTMSAIALGENDIEEYSFHVATLLSVMVGACISSLLNPRPIAFHLSPRYGPTFLIGCLFSTGGAVAAVHNEKREFYLTAIANGIMNGVSSMYSANLIRTTHLTGTTTDIGLFVGQCLRGNRVNLWKLYILAGLATFFWVGSLVGYEVSKVVRNDALILNASFFLVLGCSIIIYFMCSSNYQLSFLDAIVGNDSKCCDNLQFERDNDDNHNDSKKTTIGKKLSMYDNRSSRNNYDNQQSFRDNLFQDFNDYDNGNNDDGDEDDNNKTVLMVSEQELLEILDKIILSSTNNDDGDGDDDNTDGRGHDRFIINRNRNNQQQKDQFLELVRLKSKVNILKSQQAQQQRRHTTNGNDNNTDGPKSSKISTARQSINMIQRASILEIEATGYHLKSN